MAESEEEVVTMEEIFRQQAELEEEANAKLSENWGDEQVCTYDKGYIKQPVYACLTCSRSSKNMFGFCFGCSMNCHLNHEVIELFDKRNFKCDCGTPISDCQCTLPPTCDRTIVNTGNKYTHNFEGKYCFCNKGYNPCEDEMIQCFVCEDWFHEPCIKSRIAVIPDHSLAYSDFFVCRDCYNRLSFLASYSQYQIKPFNVQKNEPDDLSATTSNLTPATTGLSIDRTSDCKCPAQQESTPIQDSFWVQGWRKQLCTCFACRQLYESMAVSFLIEELEDESDTDTTSNIDICGVVESGSSTAAKRPYKSILERSAEQAFLQNSSMNHESKLNIIQGYTDMSEKLKAYLDTFAKSGKVVSKEIPNAVRYN